MSNLKVTAFLAAPLATNDNLITLEGAISSELYFQKHRKGEQYFAGNKIEPIDIPFIDKWEGLYKISLGIFDGPVSKAIYHKKWDEEYDDVVDFKGKKEVVLVATGRLKSYSMPLRIVSASTVIFFVSGDKEKLEEVLEGITRLGKKSAQGYGLVREWKVEEIEHDFSIHDNNNYVMRFVPTWIADKYGLKGDKAFRAYKAPFWHPDNMAVCYEPTWL